MLATKDERGDLTKDGLRRARDKRNGRYGFDGRWERLCVCGHTLGHHLAEVPHGCIECDYADVQCDCERFRLSRKTTKEVKG